MSIMYFEFLALVTGIIALTIGYAIFDYFKTRRLEESVFAHKESNSINQLHDL